jgi:hypothetical protein
MLPFDSTLPVVVESGPIAFAGTTEVVVATGSGSFSCCDVWLNVPATWLPSVTVRLYARLGVARVLLSQVSLSMAPLTSEGGAGASAYSGIAVSVRGRPASAFELSVQASELPLTTGGQFWLQLWDAPVEPSVVGGGGVPEAPMSVPIMAAALVGRDESSGSFTEVLTDSTGRLLVGNPFMTEADKLKLDAATASATPSTLAMRDASGGSAFGALSATSIETSGHFSSVPNNLSFASTISLNMNVSHHHVVAPMTANITSLTLANVRAGTWAYVTLQQDATGGRTVALHANFISSPGEVSRLVDPEANAKTTWLVYVEGTTTWRLMARTSTGSGAVTFSSGTPTLVPGKVNVLTGAVSAATLPAKSGWQGRANAITTKLLGLQKVSIALTDGLLDGSSESYPLVESVGAATFVASGDILAFPPRPPVPYTPANLPGIALWLSATGAGTNNATVASWASKVGSITFTNATDATRPLFRAASPVLNSRPGLDFSSGRTLASTATSASVMTSTVFYGGFLLSVPAGSLPCNVLGTTTLTQQYWSALVDENECQIYNYDTAAKRVSVASTAGNPVLFTWWKTGGTLFGRVNMGAASSVACAAIGAMTQTLTLGGSTTGGANGAIGPATFVLGDIWSCTTLPGSASRDLVERAMMVKYGI